MNYLLRLTVVVLLAGLGACTDQVDDAGQEPESFVFTDYSETTELFVEFSALIVGETSSFAAHFSRLSDFLPVETGTVTVILSGGSHPEERFSIESPAVAGIFIPKAIPQYAGQRQLAIALKSETLNEQHELGDITVYTDLPAALAAVGTAANDQGDGDIPFLKEQQWKVDFATEVIARRTLQKSLRALGTVRAAAAHEAYINAPVSGHVLSAAADLPQVGAQVEKGQVLAAMTARLSGSKDLAELELGVQKARADSRLASKEYQRLQQLYKENAVAERRVLEAQRNAQISEAELTAASKRLRQTKQQAAGNSSGVTIYAPISGTLAAVRIAPGSYVEEGAGLFYLIDARKLRLEARVAEADIARLNRPVRASFTVAGSREAYQIGMHDNGKLISLGQVIDPVSRTLPVMFEFDNETLKLAAGQIAQVRLYSGGKIQSIAMPEAALVDENGLDVAFVHASGESFQRRVLRLGIRDQGYVQVISGLDEGERVVTTGAYLVHLAASSPAQAGGHGHAH